MLCFELEPRHGQVHQLFLRGRRHAKALVIFENDEIVRDTSDAIVLED